MSFQKKEFYNRYDCLDEAAKEEESRTKEIPISFIDLTKAFKFEFVCRRGLFELLKGIGAPPKLLKPIIAFHDIMQRTFQFSAILGQETPATNCSTENSRSGLGKLTLPWPSWHQHSRCIWPVP